MPSTKPPSGMRDYLPEVVAQRRYVVATIEGVFQRHGFLPLETPAIENLSTLLGKSTEKRAISCSTACCIAARS